MRRSKAGSTLLEHSRVWARLAVTLQIILWSTYQVSLSFSSSSFRFDKLAADEGALLLSLLSTNSSKVVIVIHNATTNGLPESNQNGFENTTTDPTQRPLETETRHGGSEILPVATISLQTKRETTLERNTARAVTDFPINVVSNSKLNETDLASVTRLVLSQEMETTRWERTIRSSNRYGTVWAPRAARLRQKFHEEITQIVQNSQNRKTLEKAQKALLEATTNRSFTTENNDPFGDILVAVDLPDDLMRQPNPSESNFNMKAVVGYDKLLKKLPPASCVIYGAGLDYQSTFEQRLAAHTQCAVHTFDCTLTDPTRLAGFLRHQDKSTRIQQARWYRLHHNGKNPKQLRPNLVYHPWCIGNPVTDSHNASYTALNGKKQYDEVAVHTSNTFTIDSIMERLGHVHAEGKNTTSWATGIDLLKFDIEGYEWQLFGMLLDDQITDPRTLPVQISFELHTEGARRKYVPRHAVQGRDRQAVQQLFSRLWDLGYRVVYKEINHGDPACSEFVIYRIFDDLQK